MAASSYNALGQAVAGYQGQALSTSGNSWTFNNLTPNSQSSYDVYVYSTTLLTGNWHRRTRFRRTSAQRCHQAVAGRNWYYWGTVTASASTLAVDGPAGGGSVCLVQQTSATAYDADGNVTATIDAMDRVTATAYNASGQDVAGYQGQIATSGSGTWNFTGLSANAALSYDVYVYSAAPLSGGSWQGDYGVGGLAQGVADPTALLLGETGISGVR